MRPVLRSLKSTSLTYIHINLSIHCILVLREIEKEESRTKEGILILSVEWPRVHSAAATLGHSAWVKREIEKAYDDLTKN